MTAHDKLLRGRAIVVTSPRSSAPRLVRPLSAAGAQVFHVPMIRFSPPKSIEKLREAALRASQATWLVLLSPRAARAWTEVAPKDASVRIAVVGEATKAALGGERVSLESAESTASSLAQALIAASDPRELRAMVLQGDQGRPELEQLLQAAGAQVERVTAYRTLAPTQEEYRAFEAKLRGQRCDGITFSSPSTFNSFTQSECLRQLLDDAAIFAIGPTTAAAVQAQGWPCHTATPHNYKGLFEAICEHLKAE